jgi:hypothetical protein
VLSVDLRRSRRSLVALRFATEHREGSVAHDTVVHERGLPSAPGRRATLRADGTRLTLPDGRVLALPTGPDHAGARRVHRVLRRVELVRLDLTGGALTASVTGIGHRRRSRVPVSAATALALLLEGVPGAVTLDDAEPTEVAS